MPIGKTTFVLISVLTLSLLIIGTKYWKTSEELALQKGVNSLVVGELEKLQYSYIDLQAKYNTRFVPSSPANDSASLNERKICGTKYWDRIGCDPYLWLECTNSMSEVFTCFSAITIYSTNEIMVGDIIGFRLVNTQMILDEFGENVSLNYIYHRVAGINGTRFITRGDTDHLGRHNSMNDEFQPEKRDIIGKVSKIFY